MRSLAILIMLLRALGQRLSSVSGGSEAVKRYKAGVRSHQRGRLEEAVERYSHAINLDPQLAEAYSNRGAAYINLGQPERAVRDLSESLRLQPDLAVAYSNRGFAYNDLLQCERAIKDLSQAIRLNPKDGRAYVGRAASYTLLANDQQAQQDIDQAVKLGFNRKVLEETFAELKSRRATIASEIQGREG